MVRVGISKVRDDAGYTTDEYRVYWVENGRYDEGKASYHDDPEDAVGTLVAIHRRQSELGQDIEISEAKFTRNLMRRFYQYG
ncbi:hypothetical protein LCGC14_2464330 [marine sediment metagenome]|uniref:Uncharacterized protein n=1 Tax=marine sediment metagenome TaxID=412755 RepID=A0A0F9E665_9ZZZZ